jgi:methionyl-tRNA formyltransferase
MKIQVLTDNPNSWIIPYVEQLVVQLKNLGYQVIHIYKHEEVCEGDVLCLLSCEKKFKELNLNKFNLVVHESALPQGRGWSPLTWQVLEDKSEIPITLFEATDEIDSGKIYLTKTIFLSGSELVDELRVKQGNATIEVILEFVNNIKEIRAQEQIGDSSFYPKRTAKDSELDVSKNIDEQFNLLRVCDNERYPAFFYKDGVKYILKINKEKNE